MTALSFRRRLAACAVLLGLALPMLAGAQPLATPRKQPDTDRYIVRFEADAPERRDAAARDRALAAMGRDSGVAFEHVRRLAIGADLVRANRKLDEAAATRLALRLAANPRVEFAEPDRLLQPTLTPNDTYYANYLWHYHEPVGGIGLPSAWDLSTGSGAVVAVLDTGSTAHEDLAGNLVPGFDFISDPAIAVDGTGRDADPSDPGDWNSAGECGGAAARSSSWHGTHVAGTVAAIGNNNTGVVGVAFGAQVQPVRVLGKCGGSTSDIAEAILWAGGATVAGVPANPSPSEVINLSLGAAGPCSAALQAAIDDAVGRGTVVVAAAGNEAVDAANSNPANCSNVITVGATDRTGTRAAYSNWGAVVDVKAPGGGPGNDGVWSTINSGTQAPTPFTSYAPKQGTSMATPHVAGIAALMQSRHANTPALVETILKATARPLPGVCFPACNAKLVDATRAVAAATGPTIFIRDVEVTEGNAGSLLVYFTVNLSQPVASTVTFTLATATAVPLAVARVKVTVDATGCERLTVK